MPSTKGYHSYHGKGGAGKIVLIVLLCLILFAAVGFLILQRYAVYGADGSIRFELPWKRAEQPIQPDTPDDASQPEQPDIIIDEPETPERVEPQELHATALGDNALRGGIDELLAALPDDINAVAVRMKNERGELLYASALTEAIDAGAVQGGSASRTAVETLMASGRYTIARISALHDSLYSLAHMADAAILQINYPGYIWYAPDSSFYLAPEKAAAREYIVSIARECAALGFDELLFDSFGYPAQGRLSNIDESTRTISKSAALAQLSRELRDGTKEYGVRLSVMLNEATVLAGGNDATGQDLSALADAFDRIYVETTAEQIPALTAAFEGLDVEWIPMLHEARADGSYLLVS